MATIRPMRPFRYDDAKLADVVAPPYDVIGPEERARLGAKSPENIVHLDLPAGEGDAKYENASKLLRKWIDQGVLTRDAQPAMLRYEQVFTPPDGGKPVTRRGFFALVRAEPYERKVVLPHERTLSGPKEDRYKLFRATGAALSPVFLLYQDPTGAVAKALERAEPQVSFKTEDGIEHRLARISDTKTIRAIADALADRVLLIADGHHRYETTLRYGSEIENERVSQRTTATKDAAHRFVLSFLADADDPGLVVFPTHRLVHSLAGFDRAAMLDKARATFDVRETRAGDAARLVKELADAGKSQPSVAAVFADGTAAILSLRADVDVAKHPTLGQRPPVLRRTDVVILHAALLEAVLGITPEAQAAQTNLGYIKSAAEAVARIERGEGDVLFLMNPTPVETVREACLAGEVMPQKSTYFYPKVLTGLAIHVLDPDEHVAMP